MKRLVINVAYAAEITAVIGPEPQSQHGINERS